MVHKIELDGVDTITLESYLRKIALRSEFITQDVEQIKKRIANAKSHIKNPLGKTYCRFATNWLKTLDKENTEIQETLDKINALISDSSEAFTPSLSCEVQE